MRANERGWWRLGILMAVLVPALGHGSEPDQLQVGRFSEMSAGAAVTGWEPLTFSRIASHTRYTLVNEAGRTVLQAQSAASASGLVRTMVIDPTRYPVLTWEWKISNVLEKGDVTRKSGDDFAAQIYITFADDPQRRTFFQRSKTAAIKLFYGVAPPSAALAYVWGNRAEVGSIHPNAYTDRLRMIVVESGTAHLNQWRWARRDVVADFRHAFGTDPPPISGIAVMTDTDDTGESATAWYGDITLSRP